MLFLHFFAHNGFVKYDFRPSASYSVEINESHICPRCTSNLHVHQHKSLLYYSKFAKDHLFDIAYFSPIANDTPVRGTHYCVLKLSIRHVQFALIIFNSFKSIFILTTYTQK